MAGKNTAAFGLYSDRVQVEQGIDALLAARFRHEDISVLFPDNEGTKDFAHEKSTKAPEGASAGAGAGGVIGGTLGLLVGIGALAIPGLGPFIAAGRSVSGVAGGGSGCGWRHRRYAGPPGWNRGAGDSRPRPVHRGGTDRVGAGRCGRWRRGRRIRGSPRRYGYPRI